MSTVNNTIISPSSILDSSCYSAGDVYQSAGPLWIPSVFDSETDYVYVNCEHLGMPSSNSQSSGDGDVEEKSEEKVLDANEYRPPRPALPRPLNISAYTRPDIYREYIEKELTPKTENAAHSSLTTIVDEEALLCLRHENVNTFSRLIDKEMKERYADVPITWVEKVLFPASILPPNFDKLFRGSALMWNRSKETWADLPLALKEVELERWLNWVVHSLGLLFDKFEDKKPFHAKDRKCDRQWDKRTANSSPVGGTHNRKPDLSLLSRQMRSYLDDPLARPGWQGILAFIEVTVQSRTFEKVIRNMVEKAYLVFEGQPFRRFVVALCFFGPLNSPRWALVMVDWSGVVSTQRFEFHGLDGITLAQVLYTLSFGRPEDIGIDETMTVDLYRGIVTKITVMGKTPTSGSGEKVRHVYDVVRLLHATSQISGRATRVWLVHRHGSYYILKDAWPSDLAPFSEIRHLLTINQTINNDDEAKRKLRHIYPLFIIGEELGDDTLGRRLGLTYKHGLLRPSNSRVHRRIVTKPVGDPLTSFRSKYELCNVLCDFVSCK